MIKDFLKNWLLKKELHEIKELVSRTEAVAKDLEESEIELEKERKSFEEEKESLNINDYVFQNLKGYNPATFNGIDVVVAEDGQNFVTTADIYSYAKEFGMGEEDLLAEAKKLSDNKLLPIITGFLVLNQMLLTFRTAQNLEQTNFGRALVGGIELLRGEVDRLKAVFEDRHKKDEEFDKHETV